jgi:aminomethyltransferase
MPVQYAGILDEAENVRRQVGLFDLCHMGRFEVVGPDAEALLQRVVTNDVKKIKPGVIRYALVTNEAGGVLDDVLVYRDPDTPENFFVVVNAANRSRDLEWMQGHGEGKNCEVKDRTHELAMIALQGPESEAALNPITKADLSELGYYKWMHTEVDGVACSVSRTGYTGEDGFEIYYPVNEAARIWDAVLVSGASKGIEPIGLAARDTLRLEAAMALYGHELTEDINPYEARLGWAVKLKTDFIGADALRKVKEEGPKRLLVGLVTESRRVPRQGYAVTRGGEVVGHVASGTASPTLGKNIATAFVAAEHAETGTELAFRVRDHDLPAVVVDLPFYKREG